MASRGVVTDKVIVELEARLGQYRADVLNARSAFDRSVAGMAQSAEQAERRIAAASSGIRSALLSTTAVLAGAAGASGIRKLTDEYTAYTNQLRVAGVEGANLVAVHQSLFEAANRNGVSLNALGTLYGRASQAAKDLGASQQQLLQFTSGIAAAVKVQGGDPSQSSGALLQLSQALGGAIVRAEEFNSVNEGLRPVLVAVANGIEKYGGSVSKLRADVIEGKVTSQEFFQAFLRGSDQLEKQANQSVLTVAQSFQTLRNAASVYIGTANEAVGATEAFGAGLRLLGENLNVIIPALAVLGIAMGGAAAGRGIEQAAGRIKDQISASNELTRTTRETAAEASRVANVQAQASAARVSELEREAARIRQNIALTEQLLREETKRRDQAAANNAAGFGRIRVGAGNDSAPVDEKAALAERERMQQGLIASSKSLQTVEAALNVERTKSALLTDRATLAGRAHAAALAATSVAARAGRAAMSAFNATLAFFGGPIGLAITAVALALSGVAMEAGAAARAAGDADRTLESLRQRAEQTSGATKNLADKQRDQAAAAQESAAQTDVAASAYDRARQAALNAAEAIKYMTSVQRQALLDDLETQKTRLTTGIAGGLFDLVTTDQQERVNNSRSRAARAVGGRAGDLPSFQDIGTASGQRALQALEARMPELQGAQREAVREYLNNVAVLKDQNGTLAGLNAAIETVREGIRAPTLKEPEGTATAPTPKGDGSGGRARSGAGRENRLEEERFRAMEASAQAAVDIAQADLERAAATTSFSAEERRTQIAKAAADLAVANAANNRLQAALDRIDDEERLRLEELAAAKNYSAAQKERVAAAIRAAGTAQRDAARAEEQSRQRQAQTAVEQAISQSVQAALSAQAENQGLTAAERVTAERQLLDLQRSEASARLETLLAQEGISEETKKRAREALQSSVGAGGASAVQNRTADLERERLEITATLARTAQQRADAEAALLLLSQEQRRASVDLLLAQLDASDASKALAARMRAALGAVEAGENEQARRSRLSPLERIRDGLPQGQQGRREQAEEAVANGLDGLSRSLGRASVAGEGFADALLDAGASILEEVAAAAYQEVIVAPIADLARQGLDQLFGTAATGLKTSADTQAAVASQAQAVAAGQATAALGTLTVAASILQQAMLAAAASASAEGGSNFISSVLSSMGSGGARAIGGRVSQNLPVLVGENRPEVFIPDGAGTIVPRIPQAQAQDRRGGGGGNVQIVNNTGVPAIPLVERDDQGNQKITLEPMGNKMIDGAGRSGRLRRALQKSPQPTKRA